MNNSRGINVGKWILGGLTIGIAFVIAHENPMFKPVTIINPQETVPREKNSEKAAYNRLVPMKEIVPTEETALVTTIIADFSDKKFEHVLNQIKSIIADPTRSNALHNWCKKQLAVALVAIGWQHLHDGDCNEAVRFLSQAERVGTIPDATKGLAICYYRLKNIPAASEKFFGYLTIEPQDVNMKFMYADLLESDQRFSEAADLLGSIIESPQTLGTEKITDLKKRQMQMHQRAAESVNQTQIGSRNFIVTFRFGAQDAAANQTVETLESALDELISLAGFAPPQSPIEVILYPSNQFHRLSGGPLWADGIFDGRMRIPVPPTVRDGSLSARLRRILRHELVHAMIAMTADFRSPPTWFNEGLAQRFECAANSSCDDNNRDGNDHSPKRFSFQGDFLIAELLDAPFVTLDAIHAHAAYEQSLYLLFYLEQTYGENVIRLMSSMIAPQHDISSNDLLEPVKTTFKEVLHGARAGWLARADPSR